MSSSLPREARLRASPLARARATSRTATPRIRVARIVTRLNVGGPALHVTLLNELLDPARYEAILIAGRVGEDEGDMASLGRTRQQVPVIVPTLGRAISALDDLRAFVALVRILRTFRPHVVHTHLAKAGALGRVAARLAGAPVVVHTFHGNVLSGYFGVWRSRALVLIERALAVLSTRVVAISPRQRADLIRLGIARPDRIAEVPLGLDLSTFASAPRGALRAELGLGDSTPLVGIVGRLVPIKAVEIFLDAFAAVRARRPDAVALVVGDGPERSRLEAQATAVGLGASVRFLGWRSDLASVYGDLDVLALTSRNEGTPVSIIEGLAAGTPVVATDVGGVGDVLDHGNAGVMVPPDDAEAVARGILGLLGDPDRARQLAARGRAHVRSTYDVALLVRRIDDLYRSLLEAKHTRS